jgi:protein TonB
MAPIFKDAETTVTTTAPSAPASPAPKSPADATRPQPVALEIPVTINGAHTVAGSDKREPFSETTQTVLVFAHGAVVRVSTSLAPGQLVFLTNEKTKKEVVCQVLKSKSGGSTNNNYIELQFTEPAPSFWGLRAPAGPAAPQAATTPKPVVSVAPALPKPVAATSKPAAPPSPLISVPPPSPLPAAEPPRAQATPPTPPKPMVAPPAPSAATPVPPPVATPPAAPLSTAPLVSVPPPSPLSTATEPPRVLAPPPPKAPVPHSLPTPDAPVASVAPSVPQNPPAGEKHTSGIPVPPVHDYSKEIEALFSTPSSSTSRPAPAAPPEPKVAPPAPSTPSTDQLKLEAARLQAQLSSMLFTEPSAPSHAAPPTAPKSEPPADVAKKVFEIAQEPPKVAASEPKLAVSPPPPRKAVSLSADDEELKIPSWLAPLSQNSPSYAVAEPPASVAAELEAEAPVLPEGSSSIHSVETPDMQEMPIFSSQLTAEPTPESETAEPGSKKSMWIGIAAAVLFVVGSVGYFLRPMLSGSLPAGTSKPATVATNPPPTAAPTPAPAVDSKPIAAAPASANPTPVSSAPAPPVSQPSRNPEPPAPAPPVEPKASASRNTPAPEPKKPALGAVHLATPVVSRDANAQPSGEPVPSIDTSSNATSDGDALAAVASTHRAQPTAPLPVGGEVTPAQLLKSVPPVYPPVAKAQHITGNVALDCLIDASGNVVEVKVLSGPPMLHRAASDAVKQWKYKPAILDGQPTSMRVTVTVQFRTQ